jgi:hypothetical protein
MKPGLSAPKFRGNLTLHKQRLLSFALLNWT